MSNFLKQHHHIYDSIHKDMAQAGVDLDVLLQPGAQVLDYGCGRGSASLRFAQEHPAVGVLGVDLHDAFDRIYDVASAALETPIAALENLRFRNIGSNTGEHAISDNNKDLTDLSFFEPGVFKFVYSWCVFEHIRETLLDDIIQRILKALAPGGYFYLMINPLYFSARGAHMYGVLPEPWCHLLHQHDVLEERYFEAARAKSIADADLVWRQYLTLNRVTAEELVERVKRAGFEVAHQDFAYDATPVDPRLSAYTREALTTKQIVLVLRRNGALGAT